MIQTIESIAYWAVPPAISLQVDGWRLRFNKGVTRRANSVWPNADLGRLSLADKMAGVEAFYRKHGNIARFQITSVAQPTGLDEFLAENGYTKAAETDVQIGQAQTVLATAGLTSDVSIVISPVCIPAWMETYATVESVLPHRWAIFQAMWARIDSPTAFALAILDGEPVGVGLAVARQGWAGLFNIATRADARRRGVAQTLLAELARWASSQSAPQLYLQVDSRNIPALALYARLGFHTLYQYHYRELTV